MTYRMLMTQVCLLLKILYCRSRLARMAPGNTFSASTVAIGTSTNTSSFGILKPEPLALAGRISHKPITEAIKPMPYIAS